MTPRWLIVILKLLAIIAFITLTRELYQMSVYPTQPLYTVRFSLVNTSYYSPAAILKALGPILERAGYTLYQTPATHGYQARYRLEKDGPHPEDEEKSVYETMYIMGPDGKETAIAKDLTNDPKGTRPILEQRAPMVTTVAWNLGPPAGDVPQQLADLVWQARRDSLYNKETYTGIGWAPIAETWAKTPVKRTNYPDRPPIPKALLPVAPKPIPKPATTTQPKPKPFPSPIVTPVAQASILPKWGWWTLGGAVAWAVFGDDKKRRV